MYKLTNNVIESVEPVTFKELSMSENDLEELLRKNIEMISGDEKSMLIIGQQVRNEEQGRSDLTAIDDNGDIVLIEIKRDKNDITSRREAFEFQAIRYAASYATIEGISELVTTVFVPYLRQYRHEFETDETKHLTDEELATRKIEEFLDSNDYHEFNEQQRIILVASDFDNQTLSAVAWLNKNGVDISCFKLMPYKSNGEIFIKVDKVLPVAEHDDYYVDLLQSKSNLGKKKGKSYSRRNLPKIKAMLDWGIVSAGDKLVAQGRDHEAVLLKDGNVQVAGKEMSMNQWLKEVYQWSSVQTYAKAIHKETGKSLSDLREAYMTANKMEY